jgi:prophage antirepressor-like protein
MDILRTIRVHGADLDIYGSKSEPLFLAVDIAKMIGYSISNTNQMLNTIDLSEKLTLRIQWLGQKREMWFVTEYGLYEILMQSRKPIARKFKSAIKSMLKDLRLSDKGDFEEWLNYEDQLVTEWEQELKIRELKQLEEISFNDFLLTKGYTEDMLSFEY